MILYQTIEDCHDGKLNIKILHNFLHACDAAPASANNEPTILIDFK